VQTPNQQYITIENFTVTIGKENGEETGIETIRSVENNVIYSISGQKLEKITKPGIYIVNGKKILKK
jgi:hypothetical protein